MIKNTNKQHLILLLLNLLVFGPFVATSQNEVPAQSAAGQLLKTLIIPAVILLFVDIVYVLKYAKNQANTTKARPSNNKNLPTWRKLTDSGLFWFNLLAVGPWLLAILSIMTGSVGSADIAVIVLVYALTPIALPVLCIDLYRLAKRLVRWINTGS